MSDGRLTMATAGVKVETTEHMAEERQPCSKPSAVYDKRYAGLDRFLLSMAHERFL